MRDVEPSPAACAGGCTINADLHSHSTASDGLLTPAAVAQRAHANGAAMWALTDHDTLAGQAQAAAQAALCGMRYVYGVEISAVALDTPIHIVGLNMRTDCAALHALLAANRAARERRAQEIHRRLARLGFRGALSGAREQAGATEVLARPHFARYLVASGQLPSVQIAFERLLGDGKPCDVPVLWAQGEAAIAAIKAAGGVAVLAHPLAYRLTREQMHALVDWFAFAGGHALEVVSGSWEQPGDIDSLVQLAKKHGLSASGGSDFHGGAEAKVDVGCARPIPPGILPVWQHWS
ncbi:hypothetical protein AAV94_14275 [Lampropedia cohaerens]|uniref:Polymerase/histidinol phosphatase N-terminal domain-containing protein n=1 Tax=Lampropedia cohaerens TaxID=1610491 RepID=A0A0U1PWL5_9BURK|nr:PHP domain-containing protein [Lampropedia cohaerens]KKW66881.1 hypothetical protein AAV94_14275 [Lampropedia cohaerens]